jgi:exosortase/archaeosortase family protein
MYFKIKHTKLTPKQQKLWQTLLFFSRFMVLSVPLYIILMFGIDLSFLQYLVAINSYWMFKFLGFPVILNGFGLIVGTVNPFVFFITQDCTGWKSMLFFFALVFAVPKIPWKKRMLGLGLGIPLIWLGNLGRILGVVLVERVYGVETALITHDYIWRLGLIALVLLLWIVWLKKFYNY